MLIDIHAHTSNHSLWGLHVQTATIADLEAIAAQYQIKTIVLMATYFPFKKSGLSNLQLWQRIAGRKVFAFCGSLDMSNDFAAGYCQLRQLAEEHKIVGIKLYPGYQIFDARGQQCKEIAKLAAQYALPIMIHAGELHHCCSATDRANGKMRCGTACKIDVLGHLARPQNFRALVRDFPQVNFVFCHLANPYFQELRELMAQYPNVFTDISGQFLSATSEASSEYKAEIVFELKQFLALELGADRLLFGTDFPIQSYADSLELVQKLCLTPQEAAKVYWQNASQLLGLD